MIKKFTKKPLVVEAIYFDGTKESALSVIDWSKGENVTWQRDSEDQLQPEYLIITLTVINGDNFLIAKKGEWIVKGYFGELYPCPDIILKATYTEVK